MDHRGQLVEKIIRRSGLSLTKLSHRLGISRNTLYNRFQNPKLGYRFILEVGRIIHHDFTNDFPDMKEEIELLGEGPIRSMDRETVELWKSEGKYIALLEKYAKLLGMLAKVANDNSLPSLKREICEFIEQEEKN